MFKMLKGSTEKHSFSICPLAFEHVEKFDFVCCGRRAFFVMAPDLGHGERGGKVGERDLTYLLG